MAASECDDVRNDPGHPWKEPWTRLSKQALHVDGEMDSRATESRHELKNGVASSTFRGAIYQKGARHFDPEIGVREELLLSVRESRVAEASSDCEHTPAAHVLHVACLAQALNNGIVVDDKKRLVPVD